MTPQFLIVKTSSLGDIIQAFGALSYLRNRFENASIDWVVEERFASIVSAHPMIRSTIAFDIRQFRKKWRKVAFWRSFFRSWRWLRCCRYDAVFDLQGNCKSGVITLLSRGFKKVGFGKNSVREWPNILATRDRFEISRALNIRQQYVLLIQKFFNDESSFALDGIRFKISAQDQEKLTQLLSQKELHGKNKIMVCPGSKWINKQLSIETLLSLLTQIERALQCSFLLISGDDKEKEVCQTIHRQFISCSIVVERMDLPLWQNLMSESDLVIAVDSSALHLCGTTKTPSFSIFGPTMSGIFKPFGNQHFSFQGKCPYHKAFEKQCPHLRNCPTGACIRDLKADQLFECFSSWWTMRRSQAASI